eukprot:TRINITY_DN3683_c0_g2_i1.p1 TRINITY_DN3683_c0_g2~~TRINITY_DN3683_c0_g2_i1.p1  ORF type:complete len:718 (+),score=161.56 TRINITY_DN3683_c0_g2_i1:89-2155(+)
MSEGELSSEPELLVENQQNLSVTKKAEIQVEKTSVDFFDSSGEDRSEGELSEANSGGKNVKNKVTDDENNPWTQAAMGNYPSLPVSREVEEDWRGDEVGVWNEYYSRAIEHANLKKRKKGGKDKDAKRVPLVTSAKPRKRKAPTKPFSALVKKESPERKAESIQSDESSDFDFEEKEPPISLSDVIAQNNHIDLAVFAAENPESIRGKKAKQFLQGPMKKRKKKKRYLKPNTIRHESKQEYWSQDRFRSTVMQPQFCIDTTVCMYWKMYGYCNKGDSCGYSHLPQLKGVTPPTKRIPDVCKFYLQDSCQKGTNCNYYHQEFPCKYFHIGLTCYQGANCKFSHAPLNEDARKLLEKAWAQPHSRTSSATNLSEDQTPDDKFPALYSVVPIEEQPPPPSHFALSSPSPIGFPHSQINPVMPPQRYPFSPTHIPPFEPPNMRPRPHMIPPHPPFRPPPHMQMNPRFPPPQLPRDPNRFSLVPSLPSALPRLRFNPPPLANKDPSPPSYQPISYESDDPGQPPISPLSFLSDDIEDKVLTIDSGPVTSEKESEVLTILSPKHPNIDLLFQTASPPQPLLSRSDSTQSDPRLSKGTRSKRSSLSDTPDAYNRSLSADCILSPDNIFSDSRYESPTETPPLISPSPPVTPAELQFEMPLPLRDPAVLTKPIDPRVLFQNAIDKSKKHENNGCNF